MRITGNKFGYKTNHGKVKRFLERHPVTVQLELELTHFHDFEDAFEARWTMVRKFHEGWNKKSIAGVLKLSRQHVTTLIEAFENDGFAALEDKRTRPENHPDNQMILPFLDKVFETQLEYPDAGRFRLHGVLERELGEDTPSESPVGRAMAHNRLWRGAPHPLDKADKAEAEPAELPYKPLYHHQYWFIDGRPFGRPVNVSRDTAHHQGCASSPWQFKKPSRLELVSFEGTRASRAKEADFQYANAQEWMDRG